MKSGSRVVIHYSSMHEKTLPNGSIRCRMELHRASLASTQWPWATQDPRPPRDPKRRLLPPKEWLPVAPAPSRLPSLAPRLSLFQKMAYRWHLGEDQPGYPRTPEGSLEQRSSAQRWRGGFPISQEHRSGRRGARLRWWEEDQGQEAPHPGGHGGFRTQGEGPQRQGDGPRGDQDATAAGRYAISPRLRHLWLDAGYRGEDKDWVEKALGWSVDLLERARKAAPEEVLKSWAREWAKEGVAVDWQKLLPPKGFQVLPRRWVVERTFSWIDQNRRMSKDYERLCASGEAFVYAAMSRLMLRRLIRL